MQTRIFAIRNLLLGVSCVFFHGIATPSRAPAAPVEVQTDAQAEDINAFLQPNYAGLNAGMVIGLVDEHGIKLLRAGRLDNGTTAEVDGDTLFEIGSVTKTFTALLLLDMAQCGEIQPDDQVAEYLPPSATMPVYRGKGITLMNLAAQDSGLPFNANNLSGRDWRERFDSYTVGHMYDFLSSYTLSVEPGLKFQYSNLGMSLLGHVLELKAAMNYEALVVTRICKPLQMHSTCITLTTDLMARAATGHDAAGQPMPYFNLQVMAGAGALRSTANDLLKYVAANIGLTRSVLTPSMERMQTILHRDSPEFGQTALPWMDFGVYQPPGMELLGHGGGTEGCSAFIGFDKKQRRGVVVLSNQKVDAANSYAIGWRILQRAPLKGTRLTAVRAMKEYVGAGVAYELEKATGAVLILKVYPNTPASRAGLIPGLVVQKINGISMQGKSLAECVAIGKGPPGGKIMIELMNREESATHAVELALERFLVDY